MAAAVMGTVTNVANPATDTNTSITVTLGSTTVGDLNVIEITGYAAGTTINPTMTTPTGWTKRFELLHTSGSPDSFVAVYWKFYQSGDGTTVTVSWANAGKMLAVCTPWSGADPTTPMPYSVTAVKAGTSTSYSISGTTGTDQGYLNYGFANRTGTLFSALSDNARGPSTGFGVTSSAVMVSRVTASEVAPSTAFTKTGTGSNTSVGVQWAYIILGASGGLTAAASFSGSGTLSTASAPSIPGAASFSGAGTLTMTPIGFPMFGGSGTLSVAQSPTLPGAASFGGTGTLTNQTLVQRFLALPTAYRNIAHRLGDSEGRSEMTRAAAAWAIANGAKAVNIDGAYTLDGYFMASHDLTTGRVFGTNDTIASTNWVGTMDSLTTTVGGYPSELVSSLIAYCLSLKPDLVFYIENKSGTNWSTWRSMLAAANATPSNTVGKFYYTQGTNVSAQWYAFGFNDAWGYYFTADVSNLASTQASWTQLGLDYTDTNPADWSAFIATGKLVLGHVIPDVAGATQAYSEGAQGLMTGKIVGVLPNTVGVTAALSGTGTLATAQTENITGFAAFGGTGTLATAQKPTLPDAASFGGTGTLATAQTLSVPLSAAYSGTGTLAAASSTQGNATAVFGGTGTLSLGQVPSIPGTASFSGTGTLATAQRPSVDLPAGFSGSGTLAAAQGVAFAYSATFGGTGTLVCAASSTSPGAATASFGGAGTLTVTDRPALAVTASFSGTGTLAGSSPLAGVAAFTGAGTLFASVPVQGTPPRVVSVSRPSKPPYTVTGPSTSRWSVT